jgi:hypothetical protein
MGLKSETTLKQDLSREWNQESHGNQLFPQYLSIALGP